MPLKLERKRKKKKKKKLLCASDDKDVLSSSRHVPSLSALKILRAN